MHGPSSASHCAPSTRLGELRFGGHRLRLPRWTEGHAQPGCMWDRADSKGGHSGQQLPRIVVLDRQPAQIGEDGRAALGALDSCAGIKLLGRYGNPAVAVIAVGRSGIVEPGQGWLNWFRSGSETKEASGLRKVLAR